ncbi:MAG TPA: DoxX family membrane protein [Gemmatimonadaceae bacterium]|nr:DoxX family membrane protein [Gemmatimonadaceae bacterium]
MSAQPVLEPPVATHVDAVSVGVRVYAASAIVLGLVGLVWGDFAAVWQPVPTGLPARTALAYLTALVFVASGAGLLWRRSARASACVLAALYFLFAILWLPRVAAYPRALGVWNGVFEQLALVAAAVTYFAAASAPNDTTRRWQWMMRLLFGVCLLSFGATHFAALKETAALVPPWLPPSPRFWAAATGVFHLAAGLAILSNWKAVLASRLFTAMLIGFGILVWAPRLIANIHVHQVWAGNAVNFTLIGAAWLMADAIADSVRSSPR